MGRAIRKRVFGHKWTAKAQISLRAQFDRGLHCSLTELLDTTECMKEEQMPRWYFAYAQDDLNLRILCILEGTFS